MSDVDEVRLPANIAERTVPALLRGAALRAPGTWAIIADSSYGGTVKVTYKQLSDRAVRLASALGDRGVGPGDRVGILFDGKGGGGGAPCLPRESRARRHRGAHQQPLRQSRA